MGLLLIFEIIKGRDVTFVCNNVSFFYQLSVITGVFNVLIFILVGAIKIETAVKAIDKKKNAKRIENKSNVETS